MNCPKCSGKSEVSDSRPKDGTVRRRRKCLKCGHKYTSYEVDVSTLLLVRNQSKTVKHVLRELQKAARSAEKLAKVVVPRRLTEL